MNAEIEHGHEPGVGALLQASRLRCGEELRDVATLLRIRYPYLEAIEEGRYGDLPGSAYAVGFVRTYAEHLGLDSKEVVRRFKAETESLERRSDLDFPVPMAERSTPGGAIVFVGVLVAAIAYGAWYVGTSRDSFLVDLVSPLPDRLAALVHGDNGQAETVSDGTTPGTAAQPMTAEASPSPVAPATDGLGVPATAKAVAQATPSPVETAPVPPMAGKQPTTAAPSDGGPVAEAPTPEQHVAETTAAAGEPPAQVAEVPASPQPSNPVPSNPAPSNPAPSVAEPATPKVAVPETAKTPLPAPVQEQTAAAPAAEEPAAVPPPATEAAMESSSSAQMAAIPAAPDVSSPASPQEPPTGTVGGGSHIVLRAKLDSWIQVRDGVARRLLVTRLLRAGDTYQVPDQPGLTLLTGNAGALEILVDGEPVPSIGSVGTVRRDVALDADKLKAGTAVIN